MLKFIYLTIDVQVNVKNKSRPWIVVNCSVNASKQLHRYLPASAIADSDLRIEMFAQFVKNFLLVSLNFFLWFFHNFLKVVFCEICFAWKFKVFSGQKTLPIFNLQKSLKCKKKKLYVRVQKLMKSTNSKNFFCSLKKLNKNWFLYLRITIPPLMMAAFAKFANTIPTKATKATNMFEN